MSATNLHVYNRPDVAAHYAALAYLTPCERRLFETYVPPGTAVLDLGVGGGRTTAYLSARASRYVGVDYAPEMVNLCRRRFPTLDFVIADATDLSMFADESFEAIVFSFNGLDYLWPEQRRDQCIRECYRLLQENGILIFSSHNPRAIAVRPAWEQERVRAFASRLVGGRRLLLLPTLIVITLAKALLTSLQASCTTIVRTLSRLPRRVFWSGKGYLVDRAHRGLITYHSVPSRVLSDLSNFGFESLQVLGDDYPRRSSLWLTDWYYYVFKKRICSAEDQSCA